MFIYISHIRNELLKLSKSQLICIRSSSCAARECNGLSTLYFILRFLQLCLAFYTLFKAIDALSAFVSILLEVTKKNPSITPSAVARY